MALPGTKATTSTGSHAVVQAVESYIQNQNLLGELAELDDMLCDLIDMHKDTPLALKRVVQCIFNLLQSNCRWNVKFGQKLFHKLISVVIADSRDDSLVQRQLVANVLMCVHLHAKKFRSMDGKFLFYQLWSLSQGSEDQPHAAQILVHLFDDFVQEFGLECYGQLINIIQSLLQSTEIDQRKSAYFLMTKLLGIIEKEKEKKSGNDERILQLLQCSESQWSAYVTIMENLEEQQSHLILPTIVSLMPRLHARDFTQESWLIWLRILYAKLLANNNILVLRWTLMHFLTHYDLNQLIRLNLLDEFLLATNRTQLFNVENDNSLIEFQMESFLTDNSLILLLDGLSKVPWHCVPLVYWLRQINPERVPLIPKNVLFNISSRVRALQNTKLRKLACKKIIDLFKITLDGLSLSDYMIFIETLYNADDIFRDDRRLINKIKNCDNMANHIVHFNQRCFEIVKPLINICLEFIKKCDNVPQSQHGWWRLAPIYKLPDFKLSDLDDIQNFYSKKYNLNMSSLNSFEDLKSLQLHLLDKLNCETKEEKSFILRMSVDFFTRNIKEFAEILNPLDLLEQGTWRTLRNFLLFLRQTNERLENGNVLSHIAAKLCTKSAPSDIVYCFAEYAKKFMDPLEYEAFVSDLIDNGKCNFEDIPKKMTIKKLLYGETSTGDARIEAAYLHAITRNCYPDVTERFLCLGYGTSYNDCIDIFNELLHMNNELSKKKPRYFENSKEHRIKIRIARALFELNLKNKMQCSNDLWESLLEPSNQLNISYMYECLVGVMLSNVEELFDRLKTLSDLKPSQQVPLISVVHIYFMLHKKNLQNRLEDIIVALLPYTMVSHFQTRLLAQLVLYELASERIDLPLANAVIQSIKLTLGEKLNELLQNEPRLLLFEIMSEFEFGPYEAIFYITNTPFDEYYFDKSFEYDKIKMARAAFKAKRKSPESQLTTLTSTTNGNVQRKMNPYSDIYPKDDLSINNKPHSDYELIVVASLIDKLPNLGGLARTCEVFGVQTLIMATRADVKRDDFTSISMTAEKTLNIEEIKPLALSEFLLDKQMAGYKIVGAEQTAHSTSFANFRFPKKCVLLLGHEKHGIPIDLIGFLDYAVEIPQFGMVRSLNVHVTGSLFIWEFCKQHVVKK